MGGAPHFQSPELVELLEDLLDLPDLLPDPDLLDLLEEEEEEEDVHPSACQAGGLGGECQLPS